MHRFTDSRKWGKYSYLDILEENGVMFHYDGSCLSFPDKKAEKRATALWYALTGMRQIGVFA